MTGLKQRPATSKEQTKTQNIQQKKTKHWDPLIDGVKWIEKYADSLEEFFLKVPDFITTGISFLAVVTFAATLRGEWVIILVTALKQVSGQTQSNSNGTSNVLELFTGKNLKLEGFWTIFIACQVVSYSIYFLVGGFLHWHFYVKKRHLAHEWKIQPDKWLSPELERDEIKWGIPSLFCAASISAFFATYILNENPSMVYFQFDEYGWLWFFLQVPVNFIYNDYSTYILHRFYHTPFMYKHFHKVHHTYKQPTAFSVTAVHPVEIIHIQLTMLLPLFVFPMHWFPFYVTFIYIYYHGIITHSGIDFKSYWWQPWQPDAKFHDDHHVYFHCNFAFNIYWWDTLHGTVRKSDKVYSEETFHGEAPAIGTAEANAILESDPERAEVYKDVSKLE